MRKAVLIGLVTLLVVSFVGCGGDNGNDNQGAGGEASPESAEPEVSIEDGKEAFVVGMISVLTASMSAAFGEPMAGATFDAETQELTLDNFSLDELKAEGVELPYTTVSGTATPGDEATIVDLTLEGGPVKTLAFELTPEMFSSEAGFNVKLTLNGQPLEVEIVPEDLQGPQQ